VSTQAVVYCMWWPLSEAWNHRNINTNDSVVVITVYVHAPYTSSVHITEEKGLHSYLFLQLHVLCNFCWTLRKHVNILNVKYFEPNWSLYSNYKVIQNFCIGLWILSTALRVNPGQAIPEQLCAVNYLPAAWGGHHAVVPACSMQEWFSTGG